MIQTSTQTTAREKEMVVQTIKVEKSIETPLSADAPG